MQNKNISLQKAKTDDSIKSAKRKFSRKLCTFLLLGIVTILLFTSCLYGYHYFGHSNDIYFRTLRIFELHGDIVRLDEILTMSAKMAAATGDLRWEKRYRVFEPKLNTAIKEIQRLTPKKFNIQTAKVTENANFKLVKIENNAFGLVRVGDTKTALELLSNPEYKKQKNLYRRGMERYLEGIKNYLEKESKKTEATTLLLIAFDVFIISLIIFGVILVHQLRKHISELKRAEKETKNTKQFLQTIIDAIPDTLTVVGLDHKIYMANKAFRNLYCRKDPVKNELSCHKVSHHNEIPCESEDDPCPIPQILKTKKPVCVEHIHYNGDGKRAYVEVTAAPVFDENGEIINIIECCRDITKRKKNEQEREKLLHDAGERVKEFRGLYSMTKAASECGTLEELFTQTTALLPHSWQYPEITISKIIFDGNEYNNSTFQATAWEQSSEITVQGKCRGSIEVYYLEERPIMDEGPFLKEERALIDGIATILGTAVQRIETEARNRQQFQFMKTLINTIPSPVFYKDTGGRYIGCNKAFTDFLGVSRESIIGKKVHELSPKEISEEYEMRDKELFSTLGEQTYEWTIKRSDGQIRNVLFNKATFTDSDGKVAGLIGVISDITEIKQVQKALHESERFARSTLNGLSCNITIVNSSGVIEAVNDSWRKFAVENPPVQNNVNEGANYLEVCDKATGDDYEQAHEIAKAIREIFQCVKDEFYLEYPCHSPNEQRWFAARITRFPGEGKPRVIISHENITERIKAEEFVRESEERYRILFESSQDAIMTLKPPTWKFTSGNPAALNMFSTKDIYDFTSLGPWDFSPEKQPDGSLSGEKAKEMIETAMVNGSHFFEWTHKRLGGEDFQATVLLTRMELFGESFLQATVRDITQQKETEEKLIKKKEQYQSLVDNIPGITYRCKCDKDWTMLYMSEQVEQLIGYPASDFINNKIRTYESVIHSQDSSKVDVCINEAVKAEKAWEMEYRIIRSDGNVRWVYEKGRGINDDDGKLAFLDGFILDITERKQNQEKLKKAQKDAESANKAKSRFLANMSHEIRTPMNSIIGFSELLSETHINNTQREYVNSVVSSGKYLLNLINDILDFSRIEAGKLEIENCACSLGEIITSIESMLLPLATEKGIDFYIKETGKLPATIQTDGLRLKQCLINISNNAIKFTNQGYVSIELHVEYKQGKPFIRFDIEDTGVGIPEEKQKSIFESFTQADNDITRNYGGSGLGLTITKCLVEMLGGSIYLKSESGKGSTFTLFIPAGVDIKTQETLNRENLIFEKYDKNNKDQVSKFSGKILVADDAKLNQSLMRSLLNKYGLDTTIAVNGKQAVDYAMRNDYDLIFMDIQMPILDGYEAIRRLRNKGFVTPIIALTAHAMPGDSQKCINCGCNDYLSKPINQMKLKELLAKYLPKKVQFQETVNDVKKTSISNSNTSPDDSDDISVNWSDLIEMYGDKELVMEMIDSFVEEVPVLLNSLEEVIKNENKDKIVFYSHKLNGFARHLNIKILMNKAGNFEQQCKTDDLKTLLSKFEQLKTQFNNVLTSLTRINNITDGGC